MLNTLISTDYLKHTKATVTAKPSIEPNVHKIVCIEGNMLNCGIPVSRNATILGYVKRLKDGNFSLAMKGTTTSYHHSLLAAMKYYSIGQGVNYEQTN